MEPKKCIAVQQQLTKKLVRLCAFPKAGTIATKLLAAAQVSIAVLEWHEIRTKCAG